MDRYIPKTFDPEHIKLDYDSCESRKVDEHYLFEESLNIKNLI